MTNNFWSKNTVRLSADLAGSTPEFNASDVMKLASGAATPNCPKCGGQAVAPVRQGMCALPYKCTSCGQSFHMLFGMSDIIRLKDAYANHADVVLAKCNVKIIGKSTHP